MMKAKEGWIRRRWWEERTGHTLYLIYILTFVNFILISYTFFIERIPFVEELFPHLWIFVLIFLVSYIPASIIIGYWHRRTQLKVDTTIKILENPLLAKMFRTIMDVQTGKASKEEIEKIRQLLTKIEKRKKTKSDF